MAVYRRRRSRLSYRGKLFLLYVASILVGTFLLAGWLAERFTLGNLDRAMTEETLLLNRLLARDYARQVRDMVLQAGGVVEDARAAIQQAVDRSRMPDHSFVYVLDAFGRAVAHPLREYVRRNSDLGYQEVVPLAGGPARSFRELGQAGEEALGIYYSVQGPQGHQLVASVPLADLGLQVIAVQYKSRIDERVDEVRHQLGAVRTATVGVIFLLVVPAVAWLTMRFELRLERKVGTLEWVTRQLEERTRELEERNRQIEQLAAIREEYMGILAHDFRSPLTSIRMAAELLEKGTVGELPEKARNLASMIHENGTYLTELANDVLDLSRLDAGAETLDREPSDIATLAREAVRAHLFLAESRNVTVLWKGPESVAPVSLDQDKFRQVLNNLVSNAIKFTPDGGQVAVGAQLADDEAHLVVSDTGAGIPKESLDRIFDKYEQVRRRKEEGLKEGTGLGLAICKKIVELHGGRIWAESPGLDQGSSFHVVLPAA